MINSKFSAFAAAMQSTISKECFLFDAERFINKHGDVLLSLEGLSTGAAIDKLIKDHGFYAAEAKPVVIALRDSGTVAFNDEA